MTRILVAGASGGVGSRLAALLAGRSHQVVCVSRSTGIDTVSRTGLEGAMRGVQVVIDVTNARSRDPNEVLRFFETSAMNLVSIGLQAGVRHHMVLSVVGADRMPGSGHMRGKLAQEHVVIEGGVPFTIVRATQFFEFVATFGDLFGNETSVTLPEGRMRPIATDDVANGLVEVLERPPVNRIIELGGPRVTSIRDVVARILTDLGDRRPVTASRDVRYFGAALTPDTLLPGPMAIRGTLDVESWLSRRR